MGETTARHARQETRPGVGRSILLLGRDLVVVFLLAVLISFLVKTFLLKPFYIPSESMADTLQVNDRIAVSLLTPAPIAVQRGDVVVFEDPGGWLHQEPSAGRDGVVGAFQEFMVFIGLAPDDSHGYLVKRVLGLPGDTVECCNDFGQLSINGVPLNETYLLLEDAGLPASGADFSVVVPEGSYWMMGDNRYHSADSRSHQDGPNGGFIPEDNLVGRAIFISWPLDRLTWLDNHAAVFSGVPTRSAGP